MQAAASTSYEDIQGFNAITRYLHSFRFQNLQAVLADIERQIPDRPIEVLDLGCNSGRAFETMNSRFTINYRGVDIDEEAIAAARQRYAGRNNCRFLRADAADPRFVEPGSADVAIALETLEHIPEATVVRIVENVCHVVKPRVFVASVPVEIGPAIWVKFIGSKAMGYRRGPGYTWRYAFWSGLYNLNRVPTHGMNHLGFNWFWLEQTIRHNATIRESRAMPFPWLPKWIASSVMFVAEPARETTTPQS